MTPKNAHRLDRFSQIAVATAQMALADAGLAASDAVSSGMGIYTGSALGGIAFAEDQHAIFVDRGIRAVSPMLALSVFGGASSCNIAIELGLTGPSVANANSCASGTIAIGEAAPHPGRPHRGDARRWRGGASGAAHLVPSTSSGCSPGATTIPPPRPARSIVTATGSSWPRVGLPWCWRGSSRTARRAHLCRSVRLRHDERRVSHDGAASGRRPGGARHHTGPGRRRCARDSDRLRERTPPRQCLTTRSSAWPFGRRSVHMPTRSVSGTKDSTVTRRDRRHGDGGLRDRAGAGPPSRHR